MGALESSQNNPVKNLKFCSGFFIESQGVGPNVSINVDINEVINNTHDSLRLLRSTGALVLPSRVTIRLMSCSEDITHS
jgi:hypothetical protein